MAEILIIDDDEHIGSMEEEILVRAGYRVLRAYSGTEARLLLTKARPDLILLDLMLPGISGEELLPELSGIPVIVVSAKCEIDSKVGLLMNGAVDYLTKPIDTKEHLARIAVRLRESSGAGKGLFRHGELTLDSLSHEVSVGGAAVKLTRTEYAILRLLMKNPGQVVAKSSILELISADTPDCTESSLKTHMSHLRSKLREAGGENLIEAVWGIGFRLV